MAFMKYIETVYLCQFVSRNCRKKCQIFSLIFAVKDPRLAKRIYNGYVFHRLSHSTPKHEPGLKCLRSHKREGNFFSGIWRFSFTRCYTDTLHCAMAFLSIFLPCVESVFFFFFPLIGYKDGHSVALPLDFHQFVASPFALWVLMMSHFAAGHWDLRSKIQKMNQNIV